MAKIAEMKLFLCFALMLLSIVGVAESVSEYMDNVDCMNKCLKTSCQSPPGFWCNLKCEFFCTPAAGGTVASNPNSLKDNVQASKNLGSTEISAASSQQTLGSDQKKESTKN